MYAIRSYYALDLKIRPSPKPARTPANKLESKTSFTNGASATGRNHVITSVNVAVKTEPVIVFTPNLGPKILIPAIINGMSSIV